MNKILPKSIDEFEQKDYWDKFFRKLKKSSDMEFFEWYGEYPDFKAILKKYVNTSDLILNIGCGKSLMSEQMYDEGFESIINMDFSEKVIEEMKVRSKERRPKMVYEVMDVTNMTYPDKKFDIVLDKGTLDAMFPKDTPEECEKIKKMFSDIERILNDKGVYCCISLLQSHILRELLGFFTEKNYTIEINEFFLKKSKLFPYFVALRKVDTPNGDKIVLNLKSEECNNVLLTKKEVCTKINAIQSYAFFMSDIKSLRASLRVSIDIWDHSSNSKIPKYTIIIVDSPNLKILEKKTCGCFITPQGRESSYIAGTEQGNFDLLSQTGMSRLMIAIMNPGHVFTDMKTIQKELNEAVKELAPKECKDKIPFMTDGDEIGERSILFEDDKMFILENKLEDGEIYRSLMLKENLNQTQSQNKLKYFSEKERVKLFPFAKEIQKKSLLDIEEGQVIGTDDFYLSFEFHRLMIAGLGLLGKQVYETDSFNALVLGGGACILSKFLYHNIPKSKVETVELNANIVKSCKFYFDWPNDSRFTVHTNDALVFVKDAAAKIEEKIDAQKATTTTSEQPTTEKTEENSQDTVEESKEELKPEVKKLEGQYELIILDISDPSGKNISPPGPFREPDFLKQIKKILIPGGLFIINVIASDNIKLEAVLKELNKVLDVLYIAKADEELNHVVYAMNIDFKRDRQNESEVIVVEPEKIMDKKQLESSFKQIVKNINAKWDSTMNIESYCSSIALKYPMLNANPLQMTNAVISKGEAEYTNKTKELYLEDKEKVNKDKRKKKKNK